MIPQARGAGKCVAIHHWSHVPWWESVVPQGRGLPLLPVSKDCPARRATHGLSFAPAPAPGSWDPRESFWAGSSDLSRMSPFWTLKNYFMKSTIFCNLEFFLSLQVFIIKLHIHAVDDFKNTGKKNNHFNATTVSILLCFMLVFSCGYI